MYEEVTYKKCSRCKRDLPATKDYFFSRKNSRDGLEGTCKECRSGNPFTTKHQQRNGYNTCTMCGKEKSIDNFRKDENMMFDYRNQCDECISKQNIRKKNNNKDRNKENWEKWYNKNKNRRFTYTKQWKKENKEYIKDYNKEYLFKYVRTEHGKLIKKINNKKRDAKLKELPNDFTKDDWKHCNEYFDNRCAYCGTKDDLTQEHFIALNNNGGYTKENILPVCKHCNSSKQDEDFYIWYERQDFYNIERIEKIQKYFNEIKIEIKEVS